MGDDAAASYRRLSHLFRPGCGFVILCRDVEPKEGDRQRPAAGVASAQLIMIPAYRIAHAGYNADWTVM
jgi:hypothetical protein